MLLRVPFIYADHLDVRYLAYSRKWKILRNWLLKHAFAVTVLSKRDRKFISLYHAGWRPVVIYNPALPAAAEIAARPAFMQAGKSYVVSVGRLVKQKGFDRLLTAWQQICGNFPSWRLAIIGAGPDETELKNLAAALGVQSTVDFVPPVKNLTAVYQQADVYALASRAEGFPMVLLEAMAAGVPAISFNCTGPDVIIRNGIDGVLVKQNDVSQLAAQLSNVMQNAPVRRDLGEHAKAVVERFSLEKYLDAYEKLCREALR